MWNRIGILALAVCSLARAQYTTASLGGNVMDTTGARIAGARLSVKNTDTGFALSTDAGEDGAFLFPRLPIGNYELTADKSGFSTYVQKGIQLTVNQIADLNVVLKVGQVTETTTVEANADLVDTRSGTVSQLVDQEKITQLPLNGRLAQRLVFLSAGTLDLGRNGCRICGNGGVYPNEQTAGVNGAGMGQVNYQLDGVGHNDTYLNVNVPFPNPDAVQEFNLQANNFTAEYGNAGGGIVNIVTRSGTNQIHGSAFEFLRNGDLNARNFFAPTQDTLKRNQYGGSVGGPIRKDKLFFFGTYQGTRATSAASGNIAFVPTAAERTGDFSGISKQLIDPVTSLPIAGNKISVSRLDPVAQYILGHIPLPNGPGRQLTYLGTASVSSDDQFMPKADYVNGNHQLSVRYFYTKFSQPAVIPPKDNILAANNQGNEVRVQNVGVNHTYTFSPRMLLSSTFGWNQQTGGTLSSAPFSLADAGAKIASAAQSSLKAPPELNIGVSGGFGVNTNHFGTFDRGDYTWRENLTWIRGAHELHFGGEMVRLNNDLFNTFGMAGELSFGNLSGDGLADFVLGQMEEFFQGGGEFKNMVGTRASLFAQDNWRLNSRLTLNLGMRWDPWLPYKETSGRVVCFAPGSPSSRFPNAPAGLIFGGDHGCPEAGAPARLDPFAPRFGFAYRLTNDGKTSLRGGAGIFYVPIQSNTYNVYADIAPFAPTFDITDVSLSDPFGSAKIANPFPAQYGPTIPNKNVAFTLPVAVRAVFDQGFKVPTLYSWNLSLERQFGKDWVGRAAVIGNKGTYMFAQSENSRELNPAILGPGATQANTDARRRYQSFGPIGGYESGNNTHYNSLQLNLEKRFSHGYTILASYTWSKKIDDYSWTDPYSRAFDHGLSREDVPQNFKFSNVWQIPNAPVHGVAAKIVNGWMLNSIWTAQSGLPFSIMSGRDNSLSGVGRDRADYLGGDPMLDTGRPDGQLIARYFNTAAFGPNAIGTFGNSGKNILRGPRYFDVDFGATKRTNVTERASLEFRAEFFNVFNNVNFTNPNSNQSSGQFGRITSALDPRIVQFGLRLQF
ncbi:MAG: TonB-dependent receptor [Acidobacteriia bacterium]|nr:TonB-dependent receptor [Terriglobia bacterium]